MPKTIDDIDDPNYYRLLCILSNIGIVICDVQLGRVT